MVKFRYLEDLQGYGHFGEDFLKVSEFLFEIQHDVLRPISFPWGRWEWMFSLPYLDANYLGNIGVWEVDGKIVALLTYESKFGEAYYVLNDHYSYLKREIARYAIKDMQGPDGLKMLIPDHDHEMQRIALSLGLSATEEKEQLAALDLNKPLVYELPDDYHIENMKDHYDLKKYHQVLWRGFNHQGEPTMTQTELENRRISLSAPHANLSRNVAIVSPNDLFVSYCGTWYREGSLVALVEPVATDPHYRKMGLGKAAVYEALKRCQFAGAKVAIVGSGQQFYYNIGFYPYATFSWWKFGNGK